MAVGQAAGGLIEHAVQTQKGRGLAHPLVTRRAAFDKLGHGNQDVVVNRHVGEQAFVLESAHHAEPADAGGAEAVDPAAHELDFPGAQPVEAGNQVEGRALAGAVRADQTEHLALVEVEVEVGNRDQPAKAADEAARLEQHRSRISCARRHAVVSVFSGPRPLVALPAAGASIFSRTSRPRTPSGRTSIATTMAVP